MSKIEFAGRLGGVDTGQLRRAVTTATARRRRSAAWTSCRGWSPTCCGSAAYRHATSSPAPTSIEASAERRSSSRSIRARARPSVAIEVVGTPTVSRPELLRRLGLAPGAPYQPDALTTRHRIDTSTGGGRPATTRPSGGRHPAADDDRVANLTLAVTPGPHVRVVFTGDPLAVGPAARTWCRSSRKDRSTKTCSRTRPIGSRIAFAARGIATPRLRTRGSNRRRAADYIRRATRARNIASNGSRSRGNRSVPIGRLEPALRLRDGAPFFRGQLDADRRRFKDLYRGRGFAAVRVQKRTQEPERAASGRCAGRPSCVRIGIIEGRADGRRQRADRGQRVGRRRRRWAGPRSAARASLPRCAGSADRDAIQLAYANRGYQVGHRRRAAGFSADRTQANPVFVVREGPRIFVDHVLIAGNVRTSSETIERELRLKPGDPLSLAAVEESQRRLAALQLFRRAPRFPSSAHGDETTRDLLVTVEEAPPTTLEEGGGVEGRLRVVPATPAAGRREVRGRPAGVHQVARRNLFGKNRSVNLFASVSLHPPKSGVGIEASTIGYGFPEYRVLGTFHEPRLFSTAVDAVVTGGFEQQIRSSFNFARRERHAPRWRDEYGAHSASAPPTSSSTRTVRRQRHARRTSR